MLTTRRYTHLRSRTTEPCGERIDALMSRFALGWGTALYRAGRADRTLRVGTARTTKAKSDCSPKSARADLQPRASARLSGSYPGPHR